MARHKHQTDPPPALWTLDTLESWQSPEWSLDPLAEWTASLDELQSTWDQITDELEAPSDRFRAAIDAVYAAQAQSPEKAPLGKDEAKTK